MWCPTQNLDPIGSAVLTFIGYKQTNKQSNRQTDRQTDKPNLYIDTGHAKILGSESYIAHSSAALVIDNCIFAVQRFFATWWCNHLIFQMEIT